MRMRRVDVSGAVEHKFIYKLPMGVHGKKVMMQWRYVTANSCIPPGYVHITFTFQKIFPFLFLVCL